MCATRALRYRPGNPHLKGPALLQKDMSWGRGRQLPGHALTNSSTLYATAHMQFDLCHPSFPCCPKRRLQVERLLRKMLLKLLSVSFPITLNPAYQPLVC